MALLKDEVGGVREENSSVRVHQMGMHKDIHKICGALARTDRRLERIESRLELREMAEAQRSSAPHS